MIRITVLVFGTLNPLLLPIHEDLTKMDLGFKSNIHLP